MLLLQKFKSQKQKGNYLIPVTEKKKKDNETRLNEIIEKQIIILINVYVYFIAIQTQDN